MQTTQHIDTVVKRDGRQVPFDPQRIADAIKKSMKAAGILDQQAMDYCDQAAKEIASLRVQKLTVDQIQDLVEEKLMDSSYKEAARAYIVYRRQRDIERQRHSQNIKTFNEIVEVRENGVKNENANVNGNTPAGQMMKFASVATKDYALDYIIYPEHAEAHRNGEIHIHDLEFFPSRTTTCVQHDLEKLFKDGFSTEHGHIREPKSIRAYTALAAISMQSAQNEQHGGQSFPAFDFFMAEGVRKTFKKQFFKYYRMIHPRPLNEATFAKEYGPVRMDNPELQKGELEPFYNMAIEETEEETYQAMEAFIYNLCSMHARGGGQTVFSSINYGTDTSPEGRLVMHKILDATDSGLGKGETPIFPIQILKVKSGVTYDEDDFWKAFNDPKGAMEGQIEFNAPNFDLFVKSCYIAARRLFPTFLFLDASYNRHDKWNPDDPQRWRYEVATMGCRTRVFNDRHGETTAVSRGNLSFTTVNIVRPAIIAKDEDEYFSLIEQAMDKAAEQLYARYEFQCKARAKQFPFVMGQGLWKDGQELSPDDYVAELLKHGTLAIGFIGLAEALTALAGKHHGECARSQELGLKIVEFMRKKCDYYAERYNLNYTLLATPAEGLSGRFTALDKKEFGEIPGVTDKDYYTNSSHVPVYYPITASEKIQIEAPYHRLCNAGQILYTEFDGNPRKNIPAYMKMIREMYYNDVNYGAINAPSDRCIACAFEGEIKTDCPACGETDLIERIRRITGYLVGTLDRWNSYKKAEEKDRIKHRLCSVDGQ